MIEKAQIDDASRIVELVSRYAARELMLARSLSEIYDNLRDFFVFREDGQVLGCVALHVSWQGLGEIRSLVVEESAQGCGIGRQLVQACLDEARDLGMRRVFVLTYLPEFFQRFSFQVRPKEELPHKIWADCIHCPKFPDCDEVALIRVL